MGLWATNYGTNGNQQQVINGKKANAQLINQVGNGILGYKTIKQKTQRDNRVSIVPDYLGSATRAIYYKYPQKENS